MELVGLISIESGDNQEHSLDPAGTQVWKGSERVDSCWPQFQADFTTGQDQERARCVVLNELKPAQRTFAVAEPHEEVKLIQGIGCMRVACGVRHWAVVSWM